MDIFRFIDTRPGGPYHGGWSLSQCTAYVIEMLWHAAVVTSLKPNEIKIEALGFEKLEISSNNETCMRFLIRILWGWSGVEQTLSRANNPVLPGQLKNEAIGIAKSRCMWEYMDHCQSIPFSNQGKQMRLKRLLLAAAGISSNDRYLNMSTNDLLAAIELHLVDGVAAEELLAVC